MPADAYIILTHFTNLLKMRLNKYSKSFLF
jgi:hypothetical protein